MSGPSQDFRGYVRACTDSQLRAVHHDETDRARRYREDAGPEETIATSEAFAAAAELEAARRGIDLSE